MPEQSPSGSEKVQNYRAQVGTVVNADSLHIHNELGRLGPACGGISDKAVLAPTLVDRGPQLNPLLERLEAMLPTGGALLVVMPGCAADLHQALVVRCGHVAFVEAYGGIGSWDYLRRLEWPEGAGSVEGILRTIGTAMRLPKEYRQADIENAIAKHDRHLCFSHFVDGLKWQEDDGALVRRWVEYFAKSSLKVASGYFVVSFLCLVLAETRTRACREIEAYVDELGAGRKEDAGSLLVTKPLGMIRETHVADWASAVSSFLEDDVIEAELLDLPGAVFDEQVQARRLGTVWGRLRDGLTEAIRRRPRFAESDR